MFVRSHTTKISVIACLVSPQKITNPTTIFNTTCIIKEHTMLLLTLMSRETLLTSFLTVYYAYKLITLVWNTQTYSHIDVITCARGRLNNTRPHNQIIPLGSKMPRACQTKIKNPCQILYLIDNSSVTP